MCIYVCVGCVCVCVHVCVCVSCVRGKKKTEIDMRFFSKNIYQKDCFFCLLLLLKKYGLVFVRQPDAKYLPPLYTKL